MSSAGVPLVSVLTPVWNGEAHIAECIESVLAQGWTHWDYTIVDNCSSDRTREIALHYAARDPRIRVVTGERFLPVIANYNRALRETSPDARYCKVVAADDHILPDCLAEMVRVAEAHPRVTIVGSYHLRGEVVDDQASAWPGECHPGREICRANLLGGPYLFGAPTAVMYRADIVRSRSAFYDERNLHADTAVCFEFLRDGDFGLVHRTLSFARERPHSTTAYARRLETYRAGWLQILQDHGADFLSPQELDTQRRRQLAEYHDFLGGELFKWRGHEFWAFHRGRLVEIGYPLTRAQLGAAAVRFAGDRVFLHPLRTLRNLARRLREA